MAPPQAAVPTTTLPASTSLVTSLRPPSSVQTAPIEWTGPYYTLTNLGPVTTLFTPPASCLQTTTWNTPDPIYWIGDADRHNSNVDDCWPPIAGGNNNDVENGYEFAAYYSPALCPSGWVTAQTLTNTPYNSAAPSASVFACCPSPATSAGDDWCTLLLTAGMVLTNVWNSATGIASSVYPTSTLTGPATLSAVQIVVMWEKSDLVVQTQSARSTITGTISPTGNQSSKTQPTLGSTSTPGNTTGSARPSGLSGNAKTGIVVGIVTFFIAIILIAFLYFRRRGKITNGVGLEKPLRPDTHELITTANTHEMSTNHNIPEMDDQNSVRLDPAAVVIESGGHQENVHELDPASHITSLRSNEMLASPQELENAGPQSVDGLSTPAGKRISDITRSMPTPLASVPIAEVELAGLEEAAINEKEEQKLEMLRKRIEQIRAEKERLTRIQELEALEEQTRREILDTQKRVGGGG